MQARMKNPAMIIPGAIEALQNLAKASERGGAPKKTLDLVHLPASQINRCSVCVDIGFRFNLGGSGTALRRGCACFASSVDRNDECLESAQRRYWAGGPRVCERRRNGTRTAPPLPKANGGPVTYACRVSSPRSE